MTLRLRLRVTYHRPADLVSDHEQQFKHGGLFVRITPGVDGAERGGPVELDLVVPGGQVLPVDATVLQVLPGGVALEFKAASVPGLADAVAEARAAGAAAGQAPLHEWLDAPEIEGGFELVENQAEAEAAYGSESESESEAEAESESESEADSDSGQAAPARGTTAPARVAGANNTKKMHLAMHGSKDERAAILRDLNKQLHPLVLRNPNLQLDEVVAMAKMTTVSPEVLKGIADRREWSQRPEIALALVRNPKTPTLIAVKLLAWVSNAELRQLAKDTRTRPQVQQAARKKLLGP
ncbi:MAG: hypothetical protein IT370_19580 [Deltaproteobacteria bacterium]|nr:hypothetical protein [Deltaproteobacteria bacterium]